MCTNLGYCLALLYVLLSSMDVNLFSTVEEKILGIFTQSQDLSSPLVMPRLRLIGGKRRLTPFPMRPRGNHVIGLLSVY